MEMLEVLRLLKANVSVSNLSDYYSEDEIEFLLEKINNILTNDLYVYSLSLDIFNLLYDWVNYYRFEHKYPNKEVFCKMFYKCDDLIGVLNEKLYNVKIMGEAYSNDDMETFSEFLKDCISQAVILNSREQCFYTADFWTLVELWAIEYFIIKYLQKDDLAAADEYILLNSSGIEYGIISIINCCIDSLTNEQKAMLVNLMKRRAENFNYNNIVNDGSHIYQSEEQFKEVILKISNYIKNYDKPKILKKDK